MGWTLKLDREREWPAGTKVSEIGFHDPALRQMRNLPTIEVVRTFPDKSTTYEINWEAVDLWLTTFVEKPENSGLIGQLSPAESERAKDALLGFFTSAAGASGRSSPPTTSGSAPGSPLMRID